MKKTTRFYDVIVGEIDRYKSYLNNGKFNILQGYDIMGHLIRFDDPIKKILFKNVFAGLDEFHFGEVVAKTITQKYHDRNIRFESIQSFNLNLLALVYEHETSLNFIYDNEVVSDFIFQKNISNSSSDGANTFKNTNLSSDLPDTATNIDLDINGMDYADNVSIAKGYNNNNNASRSTTMQADLEKIKIINELKKDFFDDVENRLFSQIY